MSTGSPTVPLVKLKVRLSVPATCSANFSSLVSVCQQPILYLMVVPRGMPSRFTARAFHQTALPEPLLSFSMWDTAPATACEVPVGTPRAPPGSEPSVV